MNHSISVLLWLLYEAKYGSLYLVDDLVFRIILMTEN